MPKLRDQNLSALPAESQFKLGQAVCGGLFCPCLSFIWHSLVGMKFVIDRL